MSTFSESLAAIKIQVAATLAWRAAPVAGTMVTIKGVDGVHRFTGIGWNGKALCVKHSDVAIKRAAGAGALPNDRGPARQYDISRLTPVAL